jgi:hypothetical protein
LDAEQQRLLAELEGGGDDADGAEGAEASGEAGGQFSEDMFQ